MAVRQRTRLTRRKAANGQCEEVPPGVRSATARWLGLNPILSETVASLKPIERLAI
jgi:hypothetical protein